MKTATRKYRGTEVSMPGAVLTQPPAVMPARAQPAPMLIGDSMHEPLTFGTTWSARVTGVISLPGLWCGVNVLP